MAKTDIMYKQKGINQFLQTTFNSFLHSFHWHVQNATIPCHSQELLPFLSGMYFLLPPFSTNCSSILSHLILPLFLGLPLYLLVPKFTYSTFSGILFSSILCMRPNQRNLPKINIELQNISKILHASGFMSSGM